MSGECQLINMLLTSLSNLKKVIDLPVFLTIGDVLRSSLAQLCSFSFHLTLHYMYNVADIIHKGNFLTLLEQPEIDEAIFLDFTSFGFFYLL
jgi:hypothetical protein